jgi:hypothetical protein
MKRIPLILAFLTTCGCLVAAAQQPTFTYSSPTVNKNLVGDFEGGEGCQGQDTNATCFTDEVDGTLYTVKFE